MKKCIFFLITLLGLVGCGKDDDQPNDTTLDAGLYTSEEIYEKTGCKVEEVKSIVKLMEPIIDKEGNRYLYGSRLKNSIHTFWISKYTSSGDLIWENIEAPKLLENESTRGWNATFLSNGDIALACAVDHEFETIVKEMWLTIVSNKDGKTKFIKIKDKYISSFINTYDGYFICGIEKHELGQLPEAYPWIVRLSNEGDILFSGKSIRIPEKNSILLNSQEFISIAGNTIERTFFDVEKEAVWSSELILPKYISYEFTLETKEKELKLEYTFLIEQNKHLTAHYGFMLQTGEPCKEITDIRLGNTGLTLQEGEKITSTATPMPENAYNQDILTWTSSDQSVATVNDKGEISAIKAGKCTIEVGTFNNTVKASFELNVIPENYKEITLDRESVKLLIGEKIRIPYKIYPNEPNPSLIWESSDNTVATVDQTGEITAISAGETWVKVTIKGTEFFSVCRVTVADITGFLRLYFPSTTITNINGYVTGIVESGVMNQSNETVTVTRFEIRDSKSNSLVAEYNYTAQESMLPAGQVKSQRVSFEKIYNPEFIWYLQHKGKTYKISHFLEQ